MSAIPSSVRELQVTPMPDPIDAPGLGFNAIGRLDLARLQH